MLTCTYALSDVRPCEHCNRSIIILDAQVHDSFRFRRVLLLLMWENCLRVWTTRIVNSSGRCIPEIYIDILKLHGLYLLLKMSPLRQAASYFLWTTITGTYLVSAFVIEALLQICTRSIPGTWHSAKTLEPSIYYFLFLMIIELYQLSSSA